MAQKTDLNVSPYYDDYSDSKNFHRVLFKPSVAIQARELTQLQSILQAQIERFGNHVFKEGAIVMGARCTYDDKYFAVKVDDTNPNGSGTARGSLGSSLGNHASSNAVSTAYPEVKRYSGDIVYLENRGAVARAADQIEDIKLIIEM